MSLNYRLREKRFAPEFFWDLGVMSVDLGGIVLDLGGMFSRSWWDVF